MFLLTIKSKRYGKDCIGSIDDLCHWEPLGTGLDILSLLLLPQTLHLPEDQFGCWPGPGWSSHHPRQLLHDEVPALRGLLAHRGLGNLQQLLLVVSDVRLDQLQLYGGAAGCHISSSVGLLLLGWWDVGEKLVENYFSRFDQIHGSSGNR